MKSSTPLELFGPFVGHDLSFEDCERLALTPVPSRWPRSDKKETIKDVPHKQAVDDRLIAVEPSLHRRAWFDYRALHPVKRTMLFAHIYGQRYNRIYKKYFDRDCGAGKTGLSHPNIFNMNSGMITSFYRGRQIADDLAIPYDFYIGHAFECCLQTIGWTEMPRPNQIYGAEVQAQVVGDWFDYSKARLHFGEDRRYLLENYIGHVDQDDHQKWLINQAGLRNQPEHTLARVIFERPMLFEDRAAAEFGVEKIETARQIAASKISQ